jgi:ABC-type sugar transport system permease subunit
VTMGWRGALRRFSQSPWLFAGPAVAAAVVFVWLPMASTLGLSFFDWSLLRQEGTWRGLDHYRGTLGNPDFHLALVNTGVYLAALIPLQVGVPLVVAFALVRVKAKATGRVYRTALFAPSVLSFPVAAVVWLWLFNPTVGFLNTLGGSIGLAPQRWLTDPDLAIWSVIAVAFWKSFGLNLLIFLAALANVPTDVTEAARIDGAGALRQAIDIELPLISPALFFAVVTTIIVVLDEIVGAVDVLTEGGPYRTSSNLLYFLYERGFRHFQFGEAAAVAVLIAVIVAGVTWAQFHLGERHVHYD